MNESIKKEISDNRIFNYEIAEVLGIPESTFSKWFRKEMSKEQKESIQRAIQKIRVNT